MSPEEVVNAFCAATNRQDMKGVFRTPPNRQ